MDISQAISWFADLMAENYIKVLVAGLFLYFLNNQYQKSLRNLPGPMLAGFTNLWRLHCAWSGKLHLKHAEIHRKYGPVVRIGPNAVSVGDTKAIPIIYGSNSGFEKSEFYPIFSVTYQKKVLVNLFSVNNEAYHKKLKRPIANAYSLASVLDMEEGADSCSELFISHMEKFASSGESFNLGRWFQYYASDVIGEVTFNKKLGFLEQGEDVNGTLRALDLLVAYGSRCGQIPILHKFLLGNPLLHWLFPGIESFDSILNFTLRVIESRGSLKHDRQTLDLDEDGVGKDQLSRWSAISAKDPTKLSTRDIVVHTAANVMGGSDTTSVCFRAIMYNLLRNPQSLAKLIREIDQADEARQLSPLITYKEATTHLPYLQAVVKEAMRIHPSIAMIFERYVPAGGVDICGQHIPAGTNIGVNPWVVQHDPNVFEDPESFIPERWIENSPERLREMDASMFLFGGGNRICIGKNIAYLEVYKLMPEILRRFSVTLAHPEKKWEIQNRWFVRPTGLICKLARRTKS